MPDLTGPMSKEHHLWLGRANAAMTETPDATAFSNAMTTVLHTGAGTGARQGAVNDIVTILYRHLGHAELAAPNAAQGAFIPAGNSFDALSAVASVFAPARLSLLVIDPYMDEKVLLDYALLAPENIPIFLLSDKQSRKPSLEPAARAWKAQYASARPLELRLTPAKTLHDRLIIVDNKNVFILTQSLNAFAARSPASIVRVEDEAASLKLDAYKAIWDAADRV
jgi:hypothetical protein